MSLALGTHLVHCSLYKHLSGTK